VAHSTTSGRAGAYRQYADVFDLVWRGAPYHRFADLCLYAADRAGVGVKSVVDAACGTGNLLMEFAARGYLAAGFDLSDGMIEHGVAKSRAAGLDLRLAVGDLRSAPLADGCADLVVSLNTSINYLLEPDEVVTALAHLRRIAAPGGAVIVEPLSARAAHRGDAPGDHIRQGSFRLDERQEVNGDLVLEHLEWSIDGVHWTESYAQRYYDDERLQALLLAAGLTLVERLPMHPFIATDPARGRMFWVARP
jgi:SAM-dependent methyltransferase